MTKRNKGWKIASFVLLFFLIIFVAFPLYWVFTLAFRPASDMFMRRVFPSSFTLENFKNLLFSKNWGGFEGVSFLRPLLNSIIVSGSTTLISVGLSIFAGYGLARLQFKGKNFLSAFILFAYVFPPFILIVALYSFLQNIWLHNTLPGLILLHLIIVVPYCTWTLRGYFSGVPVELEEAGMVDGLSRIGALFRIVLPSSAPGVASAAIFSFTLSWSELLFSIIVLDSYTKFTLPVALRTMVVGDFVRWGNLMAGVVISLLPPLILYLLLQKYVVSGLTAGAIK